MARSSSLFFESGFIYQFWKPTAPNILTCRRIQNWESTPSHDDEGLSRRDHSEGVSRNKSGTKWSAIKTAQEAECSLRIEDIIGVTQTNRAGLGSSSKKAFSKMDPKGKRDMVSEEVRMFEEEQRKASTVIQAKQCAWSKWNDIEPIKLSWKSLIAMEPLVLSFLLRYTYDLLPNATNLKLWGYTNSDLCLSCKSDRGTLRHVLSACPHSLQMYI